jgi:pimeloyl-ACP methyl ester carboxylesterase
MDDNDDLHHLSLDEVEAGPSLDGVEQIRFRTNDGTIRCLQHAADGDAAIVWVGGARGGVDGPAGGLYPRIAARLVPSGITSLRVDYRYPNRLIDCILDTLMAIAWLAGTGRDRIVLVGHSFGGAVVISSGAETDAVIGVAALSSQTLGTEPARALSPRPLLLIHGSADAVLPDACSREIYRRAEEPKTLLLYPGCGHGFDECRDEIERDLTEWILRVLM